jgi:hypothetical protein
MWGSLDEPTRERILMQPVSNAARPPRLPLLAVLCLGLIALLCLSPRQAFAGCTVVAPVGHTAQTSTTITITWAFTCNAAPSNFELIQGTKIWGKISGNAPGKIAGSITNNLAAMTPSTLYSGLQVCAGTSKTLMYCSATFPASTGYSGAQPGSNPLLTGLSVVPGSKPGTYVFSWAASSAYTDYLASYDQDAGQQETHSPSATFSLQPGTPYTFNVEGGTYAGVTGTSWSGVWAHVNYTTPAAKPVSTGPVTSKSFSFDTRHKGDCTLQNGTIVFRSDGTVTWDAQVKTDHTHSGDYWHINIYPHDVNQHVVQVGNQGLTWRWTSMRMDDNHGFYSWHYVTTYDPQFYPLIYDVYETSSC